MKTSLLGLLVLIMASSVMAYTWGPTVATREIPQDVINDPAIITPWETDDPQPDTLTYNNGIGGWMLNGPTNIWGSTRFTPADEFELRAAYVMVSNPNNNSGRVTVYALANSATGLPTGTPLAEVLFPTNTPPSNAWIYVEFPTPVTFQTGEEFHLIYGPCPAGDAQLPGTGFFPNMDNVPGTRDYYGTGTTLPTGWFPNAYGAYMLMAGGEYLNSFTDIASVNAFSADKNYWNLPGTDFTFKATMENVGMENIPTYVGTWEVYYEGAEIWNSTGVYGPLAEGVTQSISAPDIWNAANVGMYEVKYYASAPGDGNTSNDTTWLELYVTDLDDMPYTYANEPVSGNTTTTMWGVCYNLPETPAAIDSFSLYLPEACSATVSVMLNDGFGSAPSTVVWEQTAAVDSGLTMYYPVDANIFGDKFTVTYTGTSPMSATTTGINSAANDSMMTSAWSGPTWEKMTSGDWPFTVYLDTTSAVPPEAILEVSVNPIEFGAVSVGYPASMDFTMYNSGGVNALQITSINFNPATVFSVTGFTPMTQIPAGDSLTVQIVFNPIEAQTYSGLVGILHNSPISPFPFMIPISGEGTLDVGAWNAGELNTYQLAQNQPNPFNPTTSINFNIPSNSHVELTVYNVLGKEIARLVDGELTAGQYSAVFNASELSSGIYFYRMTAGDFTEMKKMILMK